MSANKQKVLIDIQNLQADQTTHDTDGAGHCFVQVNATLASLSIKKRLFITEVVPKWVVVVVFITNVLLESAVID